MDMTAAKAAYHAWWGSLKREYVSDAHERIQAMYPSYRLHDMQRDFLTFHGVPSARIASDWFDVDHIVPLADGGTNALENCRTLCCRCHRAVTADWRRQRARGRP